MFSKYSKQGPQPGKTVEYTVYGLRNEDGTHPIVEVEHLGEENKPFWLEMLAAAGTQDAPPAKDPAAIDKWRRDNRGKNRETVIRHSARHLKNVFRDDGTPATDADVPLFIRSMPDVDFDRLFDFVTLDTAYRDYPAPKKTAEKS